MKDHQTAMACPLDGTTLVMSERSGIEIDYCPTCRGVWLDRGELDKIIERSAQIAPVAPQPARADPYAQRQHPGSHHGSSPYPDRRRKKSFFEELFD